MTRIEFQQLIGQPEGEILDFKADGYDLQKSRNVFLKDVLAMSNTPREQPGRIVLGVRWTPEQGSTLVGLGRQYDDVEFQDAFGHGRVQPHPRFTYYPLMFEHMQVGVLEIPVCREGPYTSVKDFEGLQAGAVYYRRGTQNDRAVGSELKRIFSWFQIGNIGVPPEPEDDAWRRLLEAAHRFDPATSYVLAIDRVPATSPASLQALSMVPWRCVIDFDPTSEDSGLLNSIAGSLAHHRVIHRVVRGEYRVQPEPGIHWFFARGLSGRRETLAAGDHKSWLNAYKQELGRQLQRMASSISPTPVVGILIWSEASLHKHLRTLIEEMHGAFGDSVEVVVVSDDAPSFDVLSQDVGATFIKMSLRSFCCGVAVHYADLQRTDDECCVLTTASGAPIEVDSNDWLWMSEDLDLVHRSTGLSGDDDPRDYRRGADVTWRNLQLHHDCDRDVTPRVKRQVEEDLRRRQTVRINLYHDPGGGGTTVGRRVAWDLHNNFPVATLKRCAARDTAERIAKVTSLTESSVLIVVDGGLHSERDIDDLYDFLKAGQTPAVLLQVLRRFRRRKTDGRFWLEAALTDGEADRFRNAYVQAVPSKRTLLDEFARQRNNPQRNAFFFGLTAFGKDFRGLARYVENRVAKLSDLHRRILVYLAMAHYYGQQSIPAQAFASLLGLPRSKTLDLTAAFADTARSALDLLMVSHGGEWRTAHHLVALEIMQQVLAPVSSMERGAVWRQNLSSWAKEFASFCRGVDQTTSDRMLELVRRVFVYRDNIEVLGTERSAQKLFAQLIDEVPSPYGRIEVLRHLTECFPLEAHFHAHLGRLLGLNGEYDEGLNCIEFAISLQPNDHVLHHMNGMILRQKMRSDAEKGATVEQTIDTAKKATDSFEEARRLCPDIEHGYISEVQMLIDLLDRAGRERGETVWSVLSRPDTDPFIRDALEKAEDLLDRVNYLYVGEQPSRYVLECRARLERTYENYSTALQTWDNLLSRPGVAKPVVRRQIVWTILGRKDGRWDALTKKETDRVRGLLEENLEEEVNDSTSLRLWLRAVRQSQTPPSLDAIIERVGYWKANTGALDAAYYLYVLHTIRALEGSFQSAADAERALEECRALSAFRRDRTRSFEWIGAGNGIAALVHQSRLGEWAGDFWESTDALIRLNGRIASIGGPQKGLVELNGGVKAFFVPAKSGFSFGRDENASVNCFVGFSYDGPRAWDVKKVGT
ncbi:MAG: ATP-binding protein [Deltaproteobacteria bacterium]|nr:ATP-binding protein [Deltaproteobacteria bacterium]